MIKRYHKLFDLQKTLHAASLSKPLEFWGSAAKEINWNTPFDQVYSREKDEWFAGAEINMAYNALDRHVENGLGKKIALIHDSPATNSITKLSFEKLLESVKLLGGYLRSNGISSSSKVLIYIPAIPQAVIAMLACARIGATHVVVFGGFAAPELAIRLQDSRSDVILTASYGLEIGKQIDYLQLVNNAIELSSYKPSFTLVFDRDLERFGKESSLNFKDFRQWQAEEKNYKKEHGLLRDSSLEHPGSHCTMVKNNHPLYILHTSGSTGIPKGIVRQTGPYAVGLSWATKNVYDIDKGDTIWSASDVGWVVGHSFIVYGPLIRGATTILFEGKPVGQPDSSVFFRVMAQHNVKTFFCAPTALRAIKKEDPDGLLVSKHGYSNVLESVFLAGERCDPDSINWCQKMMHKFTGGKHVEVLDHWWSTEMGWPTTGTAIGLKRYLDVEDRNTPIFPSSKVGSCGLPIPGSNLQVLMPDKHHEENDVENIKWIPAPENVLGNLVLKLPLAPGAFRSLSDDENRSRISSAYYERFPGLYDTADAGFVDSDGFVSVMGRVDDVINVAGHRLSTGTMEACISSHSSVAECCVIGIKDDIKGERPLCFIVVKNTIGCDQFKQLNQFKQLSSEIVAKIRQDIGPIATIRSSEIHFVSKLPKTRSGKILRKSLRNVVNQEKVMIPPTIEDITVMDSIQKLFSERATMSTSAR